MTGFLLTLLPHFILLVRNGFGMAHDPLPRWIAFLFGFSLFTYMMLDNMDGKQARKTGNSSTLGSLFDHGCDATNLIISATTILEIVGITGTEFYLLIAVLSISFSIPVIEQYVHKIQNWQIRF